VFALGHSYRGGRGPSVLDDLFVGTDATILS